MGLITAEQLETALDEQKTTHLRIGEILLQRVGSNTPLTEALARGLGVQFLDLEEHVDPSAVSLISEKDARRYAALPVAYVDDHTLLVAMVDPSNIFALDDLRIMTGYDIEAGHSHRGRHLLPDRQTEPPGRQCGREYRRRGAVFGDHPDEMRDIREQVDEAPIVKLVNSIMAQAADDGASDIHFEPQAKELIVRFRNDGVLHEIMSIPDACSPGVLSRLKIMADLDIAERRVPQDGRIGLMVGGKPIDMRVAIAAHRLRREDRHPTPRPLQRDAAPGRPGFRGESPGALSRSRS